MGVPIMFIDVDGTLNCFPSPDFSQLMFSQDWRDVEVKGYKIWYRASVVEFLNKLIRSEKVRPYWLTTWVSDANTLLAPALGLESFPAIETMKGSLHPVGNWWKFLRVQECLAVNDGPAIWLDDDLTDFVQELAREKYGDRLLMLRPASNPGLTDEDLAQIEAFLSKNE